MNVINSVKTQQQQSSHVFEKFVNRTISNSDNENDSFKYLRTEDIIDRSGEYLEIVKSKRVTITTCFDDDFNHRLTKKFKISDDS